MNTLRVSTSLLPAFLVFFAAGVLSLESSSSRSRFPSPNSLITMVSNVVHRRWISRLVRERKNQSKRKRGDSRISSLMRS